LWIAGAKVLQLDTFSVTQPTVSMYELFLGQMFSSGTFNVTLRTFNKDVHCYCVAAMHAEGRLLSCDQSIDRLIEILNKNRFDSGAHIDYYDDD